MTEIAAHPQPPPSPDSAPASEAGEPAAGDQLRCGCGALLARRQGDTIELKCRRCRRRLILRLLADGQIELDDPPPDAGTPG